MQYVSLGNPVVSCQYHLLGGTRRAVTTVFVYAGVAIGALLLFRRVFMDRALSSFSSDALRVGALIQTGLLLIGTVGAVQKAMIREHSTRMIESCRMMPVSTLSIIFGYMVGPTMQVALMWLVGVFVGLLLCTVGQAGGAQQWLLGNMALLPCAALATGMQVFFGVGPKKSTGAVVPIIILCFMLYKVHALPALAGFGYLSGAFAVIDAYGLMLERSVSDNGLAFVVAMGMSVFWIAAAARRFRKPYLPALDPLMAVLLLAVWCAAMAIGFGYIDQLWAAQGRTLDIENVRTVAIVLSLATLLFAIFPAMPAIVLRLRRRLGATVAHRHEAWPPIVYALASLIIAAFCLAMLVRLAPPHALGGSDHALPIALARLDIQSASLMSAAALICAVLFFYGTIKAMIMSWGRYGFLWLLLIVLWAGPPVADRMRLVILDARGVSVDVEQFGLLFASSPVGTILACWQEIDVPVVSGLVVQAVLAVAALILGLVAERRLLRIRARLLAFERAEPARVAAGQ